MVNRRQAPDDLLQAIIEDGYAYSEERAELDREERSQAQIARLAAGFVAIELFPPSALPVKDGWLLVFSHGHDVRAGYLERKRDMSYLHPVDL